MNTLQTNLDDGRTVTIYLTEPFIISVNKLRELYNNHTNYVKNIEREYPGLTIEGDITIDYLWQSYGIEFDGKDNNYDVTIIVKNDFWYVGAYNYDTNIQHISSKIKYSELVQ